MTSNINTILISSPCLDRVFSLLSVTYKLKILHSKCNVKVVYKHCHCTDEGEGMEVPQLVDNEAEEESGEEEESSDEEVRLLPSI